MAKRSKAAPVFWTVVFSLYMIGVIIGAIIGAFESGFLLILLIGVIPAILVGFMIHFLRQSLQEIDEFEKHGSEYDKY